MQAEYSLENKIADAITPSLGQLGYELVRVKTIGSGSSKSLQVMIDRADGVQINIDDCEKASRQISAILDVEDFIADRFNLEVSSPGIDRPLTRLKDFDNYKDLEAKIAVIDKVDDKRNFRGRLKGIKGNDILIDINLVSIDNPEEKQIVEINFDNIKSAKLILNDELIAIHESGNI